MGTRITPTKAIAISNQGISHVLFISTFLVLTINSIQLSLANQLENTNPFHLSWFDKKQASRYDLIFNVQGNIGNLVTIETDSSNYLASSLSSCANYSACLFRNGTSIQALDADNSNPHLSVLTTKVDLSNSIKSKSNSTLSKTCNHSQLTIFHYCSTSWNPPAYLHRLDCSHYIEWHSPLKCHVNSTNQERPCYVYDSNGKLIDLTPWIISNGSSYKIETSNSSIKDFHLNVCNEAHDQCGPNVSSCYIDSENNPVENGYNNLTSIKYDAKEKTVILTSRGQFNQKCEGSRTKSVIRFVCRDKVIPRSIPRLIRSSACESVVEWQTIHACPVAEFNVPATTCKVDYPPLDIHLDLKQLTNNASMIKIPNIIIDGESKTMLLGICQGIPKSVMCGGKSTSTTSACLLKFANNSTTGSTNNSEIVGSIFRSTIRLNDDRLYLEYNTVNKSCSTLSTNGVNVTRPLGVKVEFFCSSNFQDRPTFLSFDNCVYSFEWGTRTMCLESFITDPTLKFNSQPTAPDEKSIGGPSVTPKPATPDRLLMPEDMDKQKSAHEKHIDTLVDSTKMQELAQAVEPNTILDKEHNVSTSVSTAKSSNDKMSTQDVKTDIGRLATASRMDPTHKFLMISLIVMSLFAFVAVILIIDKKTRLRVSVSAIRRRAGQAFQPQPVPYSRVGAFSDLDL